MEKWQQDISKIDVRRNNGADITGGEENRIRKEAIDFLMRARNEMPTHDFEGLFNRTKYFLMHMDVNREKIGEKLNSMKTDTIKHTSYQIETDKYKIYLENNETGIFDFISYQIGETKKAIEPIEKDLGEKARSILDFYSAKNGWGLSQFFKEDRKSITYNEWETTLEILQDKRSAEEAIRKLKKGLKEGKTIHDIKKDKIVSDFLDSPEGKLLTDIVNARGDEKKIKIANVRYLLNQARYLKNVGYGGDMIAQKYYNQVANLEGQEFTEFAAIARQEKMGAAESFHRGALTNLADTFLSLDQVALMVAGGAIGKTGGMIAGKSAKIAKVSTLVGENINKSKIAKAMLPGVKVISKTATSKAGKVALGTLNFGLDIGKTILIQGGIEKIWGKDAGKIAAAVLVFLPGAKAGFESQMKVNLARDTENMREFAKWTLDRYGKEKTEVMIYEGMVEATKKDAMKAGRLFSGISAEQTNQLRESAKILTGRLEDIVKSETQTKARQTIMQKIGKTKVFSGYESKKQLEVLTAIEEGKMTQAKELLDVLGVKDPKGWRRMLLFGKNYEKKHIFEVIEKELEKSLPQRQEKGLQLFSEIINKEKFPKLSTDLKIKMETAFREGRILDGMMLVEKSGINKTLRQKIWGFLKENGMQLFFAPMFLKKIYENPDDIKSWTDSAFEMLFFYLGAGMIEKAFGMLPVHLLPRIGGILGVAKGVTEFIGVPVGGGVSIMQGEHILENKLHLDKNLWKHLPEGRSRMFEKAGYGKNTGSQLAFGMCGFVNDAMDKAVSTYEKIFGTRESGVGVGPVIFYQTAINLDINPETFMSVAQGRNIDYWNKKTSDYCDKIVAPKLTKLLQDYKKNSGVFSKGLNQKEKNKILDTELQNVFNLHSQDFYGCIKANIRDALRNFIESDIENVAEYVDGVVFMMKESLMLTDRTIENRKVKAETDKRGLFQMVSGKEAKNIVENINSNKQIKIFFGRFEGLIRLSLSNKEVQVLLENIINRTYGHQEILQTEYEKLLFRQIIDGSLGDQLVEFLNLITSNERSFQFIRNVENQYSQTIQ